MQRLISIKKQKTKTGFMAMLDNADHHPHKVFNEICESYCLGSIREELHNWQLLALGNDESCYDKGHARTQLILFCDRLLALIKALYLVQQKKQDKSKTLVGNAVTEKLIRKHETDRRPQLLSEDEIASPALALARFFECYSSSYANTELLDLLEAALTYQGKMRLYRIDCIFFYRMLKAFVLAGEKFYMKA